MARFPWGLGDLYHPPRITPGSTKPLGVPLQGKTEVPSELGLAVAPNECVHEVLTAQQGPVHLREGLSIGGSTAVSMSWCWGGRKHSKALLQHRMGRRSTQLACTHPAELGAGSLLASSTSTLQ